MLNLVGLYSLLLWWTGHLVFSEHGVYSILLTQIWHLYSLLLTLLPNQRLVDMRYNTTTSDSSFDE